MLEAVLQEVHDVIHLILGVWLVLCAHIEDDRLAPLVELANPIEQVDDELSRDVDAALVSRDFIDGLNSVDHHQSVSVLQQLIKLLKVVRVALEVRFIHMEELDAANNRSLFDVWIVVS